jgi:hypothetical protein
MWGQCRTIDVKTQRSVSGRVAQRSPTSTEEKGSGPDELKRSFRVGPEKKSPGMRISAVGIEIGEKDPPRKLNSRPPHLHYRRGEAGGLCPARAANALDASLLSPAGPAGRRTTPIFAWKDRTSSPSSQGSCTLGSGPRSFLKEHGRGRRRTGDEGKFLIDQCRPHRETVTADGCRDTTVASAEVFAGGTCEGTVGDISYLPEKASRENRRRSAAGRDQASPI